jgi:hypothetical protein
MAAYQARARGFGAAMVARARFMGGYLEDPPRRGVEVAPLPVMLNTGSPLREIPGLAGYLDAPARA